MAVTLRKLEGPEIPEPFKSEGLEAVYQVLDSDGQVHIRTTDLDAAALVVELSEREQDNN